MLIGGASEGDVLMVGRGMMAGPQGLGDGEAICKRIMA